MCPRVPVSDSNVSSLSNGQHLGHHSATRLSPCSAGSAADATSESSVVLDQLVQRCKSTQCTLVMGGETVVTLWQRCLALQAHTSKIVRMTRKQDVLSAHE